MTGNLWRHSSTATVQAPPLAQGGSFDLVVIGGGFTGTAAALEAARRGAKAFGPRAYACFGYSGRGICPGTVFGTEAAIALLEGTTDNLPVAPVPAHHERMATVQEANFETGASLTHAIDRGPLI